MDAPPVVVEQRSQLLFALRLHGITWALTGTSRFRG